MAFTFLHLADPHIDSPMKGLRKFSDAPVETLRAATRHAFSNAIDYAIKEEIPLIVIAGDLFDSDWEDIATGLWVVGEFRRLQEHDIHVCLIRGNHDSASTLPTRLNWPSNVYEMPADKPSTWQHPTLPVAVHGQSFEAQAVTEDLAALYPPRRDGLFNIGLLHTSLDGESAHSTYAPTSKAVLYERNYDYWALGHIHKREQFPGPVPVVYSGNMQGRSVRETGPRGGYVVGVEGSQVQTEFVAFDTVRWELINVAAEEDDTPADLIQRTVTQIEDVRSEAGGRPVAARVTLAGVTEAHHQLVKLGDLERFEAELRSAVARWSDVWIEKVRIRTTPPADLDAIRADGGVLAMLLDRFEQLPPDLETLLAPLQKKLTAEGVQFSDCDIAIDGSIDDWSRVARAELLAALASRSAD